MAFAVKNHVLMKDGKPIAQTKTPNLGGAMTPRLLVMHYTASQSAKGAISWLCNPAAKASAHLVIDDNGAITQLAPLNRVTWHAGRSSWKWRAGCNSFSIGIELSNPGPLTKLANGKFVDSVGRSAPADRVAVLRHRLEKEARPWMIYPAAQIDAAIGAAQAICAEYGVRDIAGHDEIAPGRKRDPGPAFPMPSFVSRVFGRQ